MITFPNAADLQANLLHVKEVLLDDDRYKMAQAVQDTVNLLEVVKRIDSYTTVPMESPSPPLRGFPMFGQK